MQFDYESMQEVLMQEELVEFTQEELVESTQEELVESTQEEWVQEEFKDETSSG